MSFHVWCVQPRHPPTSRLQLRSPRENFRDISCNQLKVLSHNKSCCRVSTGDHAKVKLFTFNWRWLPETHHLELRQFRRMIASPVLRLYSVLQIRFELTGLYGRGLTGLPRTHVPTCLTHCANKGDASFYYVFYAALRFPVLKDFCLAELIHHWPPAVIHRQMLSTPLQGLQWIKRSVVLS